MIDQIDTSVSTAVAAAPRLTSNGKGRIVWPGGPAKKQYFSLPDNIIYYISQNPSSPKNYLKLAMSCKFFFEKKSLLIVARITGDKFCSSKDEYECHFMNMQRCCINVDLAKLSSKIWITNQYYFLDIPSFDALLPQKLYNCEKEARFQSSHTRIVFENFKLVAAPFQKFHLHGVKMIDKDGNIVQLEEILGSLLNVKEFVYYFHALAPEATALTMKKICELDNLDNLRLFHMNFITQLFDVKDFEDFIMNHKDTKFRFDFPYNIHSKEYMAQLDGLCDAVIKSKVKCTIEYRGQDKKKFAVMRQRY